ncbi:hypothetical protein JYT51_01365 [Candidatus Amoebophilus asiaticus]|nr:hypothetical protein [Candidatus Amoebophilus asiaticus]
MWCNDKLIGDELIDMKAKESINNFNNNMSAKNIKKSQGNGVELLDNNIGRKARNQKKISRHQESDMQEKLDQIYKCVKKLYANQNEYEKKIIQVEAFIVEVIKLNWDQVNKK